MAEGRDELVDRRPANLRTRPWPPRTRRVFRGRRVPEAPASEPSEDPAAFLSGADPGRSPAGPLPIGVNPLVGLKLGRFLGLMSL